MQSPSSTSKWRCSEPFNPSINSTSINKCGLAGGQAYVKCRMDLYYVMDVDVLDQIIWVKSTRVRSDANEMKILSYFVFLIFKPVFEHWTGGETMPTNQMERHFRLLIHPCNGTRYYSCASHLNHLVRTQEDTADSWLAHKMTFDRCWSSSQVAMPPCLSGSLSGSLFAHVAQSTKKSGVQFPLSNFSQTLGTSTSFSIYRDPQVSWQQSCLPLDSLCWKWPLFVITVKCLQAQKH